MKPLLTAHWNNLVMLHYEVDSIVLKPYLPAFTQPDLWNNKCFISLVAFQFRDPKLQGWPILFYKNFPQVNLRFHITFNRNGVTRKGLVFIKEIATGHLLKTGASVLYHERYTNLPTRQSLQKRNTSFDLKYEWYYHKEWNYIHATADKYGSIPQTGSVESFVTDRLWGYTKISNSKTAEFEIEHVPWHIHRLETYNLKCDSKGLYGEALHTFLSREPAFAFMVNGSFVKVYGKRLYSNLPYFCCKHFKRCYERTEENTGIGRFSKPGTIQLSCCKSFACQWAPGSGNWQKSWESCGCKY